MKKYFFLSKKLFIKTAFVIILDAILTTAFAYVTKELVDISISKNLTMFFRISIFSIIYILIMVAIGFVKRAYMAKITRKIMFDLKNDIFSKLIHRNKMDFDDENTASYISIITNDLEIMYNSYYMNYLVLIQTSTSFISAVALIFKLNVYIAVAIISLSFLPLIIPHVFGEKLSKTKKDYSDSLSKFLIKSKDIFAGFEVIKSFNIQKRAFKEYENVNGNVEGCRYKYCVFSAFTDMLVTICSYSMHFVALVVGVYLVIRGETTIGTFIAAIQVMDYISFPIINISRQIGTLKSVKSIKEKIEMILKEDSAADGDIEKSAFLDSIEFKEVSFAYKDNVTVLNNVSFKINKGKKYAIVGKSGSGKSTILRLLLRYYDNFKGEILIDGVNNRNIKLRNLYDLIAILQQNIFMFDANIKDNITLFQDYNDDALDKVIIRSGLYNFVNTLEEGVNTFVGENGANLSGGEKQRVAIARALIKNTPVLVLDEATASLDNETTHFIEKAILDLSELTVVTITHKLYKELLDKYDSIIVVEDGAIVEEGNFHELMENKSYFYKLFVMEKEGVCEISS